MYLAEIHGKLSRNNENKEDILTSNVFSFFKYSDRIVFLKTFLQKIDIIVSAGEAQNAEFLFWPTFSDKKDRTEPDLVILVGNYYVLFEAKYFSGFGKESEKTKSQLVRELEGGMLEAKNMNKVFKLVAVTKDHFFQKQNFSDIPDKFWSDFKWINWQEITLLISTILENNPEIGSGQTLLACDLIDLMLKKGLRDFRGMEFLLTNKHLAKCPANVFYAENTERYRDFFGGFITTLSESEIVKNYKKIEPLGELIFLKGDNYHG